MLKEYEIERIKKEYTKGTEIELIYMSDNQAVPSGTRGVVDFVNDVGTIFVDWENGSLLGLIYGEDQFKIIKKADPNMDDVNKKI